MAIIRKSTSLRRYLKLKEVNLLIRLFENILDRTYMTEDSKSRVKIDKLWGILSKKLGIKYDI